MDYLKEFIVHNFVLFCLALVMVFNAIMHYSQNKRISICTLCITGISLVLAGSFTLQNYAKAHNLYYLAMTLSILGYALRPVCVYLFIRMNRSIYTGKWSFLIWVPLVINAIIYLCAYIPGTKEVIFGFNKGDNGLSFVGGPLRFSSHIISLAYLLYVVYISVSSLQAKHFMHGVTVLICASFTIAAVCIESFLATNGDIEVLNTTIMVSTLTYYLFLYKEHMAIDALTGLFNRDTLYRDIPKMTRTITAVIQFDMNGLKYINDHIGHFEGDKALATITKNILKVCKSGMYAYRMGGDEFIVLVNNSNEETIIKTIEEFKKRLAETTYYCSVGYAYAPNHDIEISELMKMAEKEMYKDKEKFYKSGILERRRA